MIARETTVLAIVLILFAVGCGSSEDLTAGLGGTDYVVTYRSNRIVLQEQPQEWLLSVQAVAGCEALPCTPDTIRLVFVGRPDRSRYAENHRLVITGGGLRLEWPGPSYDAPAYTNEDGSERVYVNLSFAHFRDIAFADALKGRLGPTIWKLSYEERASLRSMVRQME